MWYLGEGICLKLTHKSLKRGQREPVSPVVDTEDLYRRYLRIRAEREYFREHDSSDWNIRELEKKTFFLPWQLNICTNHRDFRRGGAGAEVLVLLPLNARIKFQIRPSFLFTACLNEDFSESEVARLSFNKKDFMGGFGFGAVYMKSFFSQGRTCEIKYCVAMHRCLAKGA